MSVRTIKVGSGTNFHQLDNSNLLFVSESSTSLINYQDEKIEKKFEVNASYSKVVDTNMFFGYERSLNWLSLKGQTETRTFTAPKDSLIKYVHHLQDGRIFIFYASTGLGVDSSKLGDESFKENRQTLGEFSFSQANRLLERSYELGDELLLCCEKQLLFLEFKENTASITKKFTVPVSFQIYVLDFVKLRDEVFFLLLNSGLVQIYDLKNEKFIVDEDSGNKKKMMMKQKTQKVGNVVAWKENYLLYSYGKEIYSYQIEEFQRQLICSFEQDVLKFKKLDNGNFGLLFSDSFQEYKF